jgi:hypothetical protein
MVLIEPRVLSTSGEGAWPGALAKKITVPAEFSAKL